jgi:hypothetical protein
MRQVKGNAPFVGPRGSGTGKQSFSCTNAETVITTGAGTDYFPTLFPDSPVPNNGVLFPFPISKGVKVVASGSVGSAPGLPHDNVHIRFVFNDGTFDSPDISLGSYTAPDITGFTWKLEIDLFPSATYNPEQTIFAYRNNAVFTVIQNSTGTKTVMEEIDNSNSMVFTLGELWYPKVGFSVGSASKDYVCIRTMFKIEER